MKSWSRLCFLVLVVSSGSRGEDQTVPRDPLATPTPPPLPDIKQHEATPSTPSPQNNTSANTTDMPSTAFTTQEEETRSSDDLVNKTTEEVNSSTAAQTTTPPVDTTPSGGGGVNVDVTTPASTSTKPAPIAGTSHSSWGYVVLVLIFLVIIVLCIILFFLRRVSRTYSFDLHRQVPANHLNDPIGTFEPVYLDDLERPAPKDQVTTDDLSPPPVSNGTTLQSEERGSNGESAPEEPQDANGLTETSPTSNTSPSLDDDPTDQSPSPLSSTNLFFDAIGEEQQNENNNNPSVCSTDPFVEINLDEPAWCNQLLAFPEAPSSVLPFSPFSFSSSSSSSSSS